MIKVTFTKDGGGFRGFEFSGHSGYADEGFDIVCAAVSSAAYLTANNAELFGVNPDVTVNDGYMKLSAEKSDNFDRLIDGLYRHMLQLEEQYENYIKVEISEV